ncbi:unnamed protein product, partial [Staurois parvus]
FNLHCFIAFTQGRTDLLSVLYQGRTDNSWGPRAIGDHGAPESLPKPKLAYEKNKERYQGHLFGPPTDPGPSGSARMVSLPLFCTI